MKDWGPTDEKDDTGKKSPGEPSHTASSTKKTGGRPTSKKVDLYVVVADDDVDDHKLITKAVTDCGVNHMVTSVYNGLQLLNLLLRKGFYKVEFERLPDIIILDLKMPVMDGYEALKKIRANEQFQGIPVFVLTDSETEEINKEVLALGADKFYTKPFSYEKLKKLMQDICAEGLRLAGKRRVDHA